MSDSNTPTDRELEILHVLWERKEASVRDVYEVLSQRLPIVQNTVQAFLRTMEEKELVSHRVEGRTFIYRPLVQQERTKKRMVSDLLHRAFDGAVDQLVQSVFSAQRPTEEELKKLESMIADLKKQVAKKKN
jgi:predicted transcriptional regulator